MTYCLALRLDDGLVFLADTRTNTPAWTNVGTYRKLHVVQPAPDRIFVLESAGNLATTQEAGLGAPHPGTSCRAAVNRREPAHGLGSRSATAGA
jgi:hypothetical protein